jgi:hypothetical protein
MSGEGRRGSVRASAWAVGSCSIFRGHSAGQAAQEIGQPLVHHLADLVVGRAVDLQDRVEVAGDAEADLAGFESSRVTPH